MRLGWREPVALSPGRWIHSCNRTAKVESSPLHNPTQISKRTIKSTSPVRNEASHRTLCLHSPLQGHNRKLKPILEPTVFYPNKMLPTKPLSITLRYSEPPISLCNSTSDLLSCKRCIGTHAPNHDSSCNVTSNRADPASVVNQNFLKNTVFKTKNSSRINFNSFQTFGTDTGVVITGAFGGQVTTCYSPPSWTILPKWNGTIAASALINIHAIPSRRSTRTEIRTCRTFSSGAGSITGSDASTDEVITGSDAITDEVRTPSWNVLYFGSDEFSLGPIRRLHQLHAQQKYVNRLAVVSSSAPHFDAKKKSWVVPPLLRFADEHGIQTVDWKTLKRSKQMDEDFNIALVASFGDFIPGAIISQINGPSLNFHPSLLPKYRGASPIMSSVFNGDAVTGISVQDLSPKAFDVGRIWLQVCHPIPHRCHASQLTADLSAVAAGMVVDILDRHVTLAKHAHAQDASGATYTRKFEKSSADVSVVTQDARTVDCAFRALNHKFGGVTTTIVGKKVKLVAINNVAPNPDKSSELSASNQASSELIAEPGQWIFDKPNNVILIRCASDWLVVSRFQMEKKAAVSAKDFFNGHLVQHPDSRFT